ncbi:MAG: GNAT family N-acetyltransferase [Chitinophagales bacterium]|nr:GNAT family N-acetyltransferase [Chitinophagales bacterium]
MKIAVINFDIYLTPYYKTAYVELFDLIQKNKQRLSNSFSKMLPQNETKDKSLLFVLDKMKQWKQKKQFAFLIFNSEDKIIGHFNIREINWHKQEAELSYWLDEAYVGKGTMTAIIQTMCNWLFTTTTIKRVIAKVVVGNVASEKVLSKNGFQYEGTLSKACSNYYNEAQDANQFALEKR